MINIDEILSSKFFLDEELLELANKALESQNEFNRKLSTGEITVEEWAKQLLDSMGEFPSD